MASSAPQILNTVEEAVAWLRRREAQSLTLDSRTLQAGAAWLAWPGARQDPRDLARQALKAGAAACLLEAENRPAWSLEQDSTQAIAWMPQLKTHAGEIASQFWGKPSHHLRMFAVTGTNGKTSCAWWLAQALTALGERCAVVGTLGIGEPGSALAATGLTTPDALTLQKQLARLCAEGFKACVIEASSIGMAEARMNGVRLDVAVFTNFTQDHLDYHGDMGTYWAAKERLFYTPNLKTAVINSSDPRGAELLNGLSQSRKMPIWTYSIKDKSAHLFGQKLNFENGELEMAVCEASEVVTVRAPVIGEHNAMNILAVMGVLRGLDYSLEDAAGVCSELLPVPGRMEWVKASTASDSGDAKSFDKALPKVVVDYAHTPDALEKALLALQPVAKARGGELWCVFGCGGGRDAAKRPLMGAVAQRCAQNVIVTSDNPRNEEPSAIVAQVLAGVLHGSTSKMKLIIDRAEAIHAAIQQAQPCDLILIAGKGHETTQEIQGELKPFSDVAHARAALDDRWARKSPFTVSSEVS